MSKIGIWREPNWYWDERHSYLGWRKKEICDHLRRCWKARKKGENARRRKAK